MGYGILKETVTGNYLRPSPYHVQKKGLHIRKGVIAAGRFQVLRDDIQKALVLGQRVVLAPGDSPLEAYKIQGRHFIRPLSL